VSSLEAVSALFIAFGAHRNTEQARLYVGQLDYDIRCEDCVELAVQDLMRSAKRLPSLAEVLSTAREILDSGAHVPHIAAPQLAPKSETWWRAEAVKLILPFVKGDRNLAAFISAQMWWMDVEGTAPRITWELKTFPAWVQGAKDFTAGKEMPPLIDAAFRRARWASEHGRDDEIPFSLLNLEPEATLA
jgi:hypothetical protein